MDAMPKRFVSAFDDDNNQHRSEYDEGKNGKKYITVHVVLHLRPVLASQTSFDCHINLEHISTDSNVSRPRNTEPPEWGESQMHLPV
jgi:hypothetical protein